MGSDKKSNENKWSRRHFVKTAGLTLSLCPLIPACEFVKLEETDVGQRAIFDVNEPEFQFLQDIGGMACAEAGALQILLIRISKTRVNAYERFCPHQNNDMGRNCGDNPNPAAFDAEQGEIRCQWHGATFNLDGEVLSWPDRTSQKSLETFPVEFNPDTGVGTVSITDESAEGTSES